MNNTIPLSEHLENFIKNLNPQEFTLDEFLDYLDWPDADRSARTRLGIQLSRLDWHPDKRKINGVVYNIYSSYGII